MLRIPVNFRFPVLLFFIFISCFAYGQIRIASPYSRYGVGDICGNLNAWNFSMGQTGIAFRDHYHVNFVNPASYTAFDSSSFVFEGAFNVDIVKLKSDVQSANRNYASLAYLLFGIPVTKWWRTSIGIVPYSKIGYNVASPEEIPDVGNVTRLYTGEGGINRFYWGNGFRILRDLSVGINFSYLFGVMNRKSIAIFPDSMYYMNMKVDNFITINDIYLDYGVQYHKKLKKDLIITAGAVFSANSKINARTDMIMQSFLLNASGTEFIKDTLLMADGYRGNILIPMMIGTGLSFEKNDLWMAGVDFKWQNWKKFKAFDLSDSLVNSFQVSAGAEILPDINSYSNYLKRIRYRLGFLYNSGNLYLRGKHLNEYAFSIGFGLPLKGMRTALNLGLQVGSYGTTEANLIRKTYFTFVVGFSIYDRWFMKFKYQ